MRWVFRWRIWTGPWRGDSPCVAVLIGLIGATTLSFPPAHADEFAGDVPDRVWIDLGAAADDISTEVSVSTPNGVGTTLNLERFFDMPGNVYTGRMFGTVRISPHRRYIDFGYEDIRRSGTRTIDQEIVFGDYTLLVGANVTARFATGFIYAAFRYDFLHQDAIRISGSAGLTYTNLRTSLAANASFVQGPGVPSSGEFQAEESAWAPVPMVGVNLDWALTRRLVARGYIRFFRLNINKFDGGLYENGVRLNWYFAKNFGMGLGFDQTILSVQTLEMTSGNIGQFGYDISGFSLFFNLAF